MLVGPSWDCDQLEDTSVMCKRWGTSTERIHSAATTLSTTSSTTAVAAAASSDFLSNWWKVEEKGSCYLCLWWGDSSHLVVFVPECRHCIEEERNTDKHVWRTSANVAGPVQRKHEPCSCIGYSCFHISPWKTTFCNRPGTIIASINFDSYYMFFIFWLYVP